MNLFPDRLAVELFELDQRVLDAADFDTLSGVLVHWALDAGLDGAYAGRPDAQGWIRPGPLAGKGMQAYLERTRISILDTCAEGRGQAGHAWRTRQVQIGALPSPADSSDELQPGEDRPRWPVGATVPLSSQQQCVGLLCLFSRDDDVLLGPEWAIALSHISLIANVALDRLRLNAEQDRLRELSLRDPLTGLPNMTGLAHYLEHAVPRALRAEVPLVIGLLDLDKFKPVNDMFGHAAGDCILRVIAARLREILRATDFVARRSGDEFVIVLEGVQDPERALVPLLERLHARLTQPIEIVSTSWHCGVSLGLALCPDVSINTPDDALSEADRALRASKLRRDKRKKWWLWASLADSPARRDATSVSDPGPYSLQWASELASLSTQLQRSGAAIVNDFYEHLDRQPQSRRILDALSGPERQHLKSQQVRNLFALADAGLTEADHRATALRIGRIHAMVGLDREELLRSRALLATAVYGHLGKSVSRDALQVFAQRLNRDLVFQTEAYQYLQGERQDVLQHIARHAWNSESYADLIARVVETLGGCEEVAGAAISRPDRQGVFRVESASGCVLEGHPVGREHGSAGAHRELGLLASAWHSGEIERSMNISTDPGMAAWRSIAAEEGLRSCVAIPLCLPGQAPIAILTLHSRLTGGYSSADQIAFVDFLQTLLAFALGRIRSQEGQTHTIPHATRRKWRTLLRADSLHMHCQPILDLKTGRVAKVEMLARLDEGSRLLTPGEFFPALRPDDFLELYVRGLRQSLSHRTTWIRNGIELAVSLNLPSSALLDIRYFEATRQALKMYACPPQMLMLELLEADALPSDVDVSAELGRFRSLGVGLAEDDLGAGHSSLLRLRELPFDSIKIDRSMVSLAGQNASNVLSFIYQLTRLGHSLGKSVIVEGVESEALLEACSILHVDAVQGNVIARPMPADQLIEWLGARPAWSKTSNSARTALGKLALLLIWEERLHLIGNDRPASERLAEIVGIPPDASAIPATPSLPDSWCRDCELSTFFTGVDALLSGAATERTAAQAMLNAAVAHGPRSAAYSASRELLISALSVGESVA